MIRVTLRLFYLLSFGFIIVFIFSKVVPYNMDEFMQYHPIICHHYKYNSLNTFRVGCNAYDLNFLNTGLVLPLRAYAYLGSLASIYYYPLFLIWESPVSARFMGVIFILIQSLVLGRIFKVKVEYIFLGLICFFPYSFQHIVDTGPVGFPATSIFIIYYLFLKWFENFRLLYPIGIAVVIFLGIWAKLSYFWLLPGIGLMLLMTIMEKKEALVQTNNQKKLIAQFIMLIILLALLLNSLFLSTKPDDSNFYPYLNQIFSQNRSGLYSLSELIRMNNIFKLEVIQSLINPFEATQRIFHVRGPSISTYIYNFFIYLSPPLLCLSLFLRSKKHPEIQIINSFIFFFIFIITFCFILITKGAWAMHHTILSFPFLILSFLSIMDLLRKKSIDTFKFLSPQRIIKLWFLIFLLLNSYFFISFKNQDIKSHDDFSKVELNKVLKNEYLSKNYFYTVIDWGMYLYQGLYGDENQSVLYMEPLKKIRHINQLKELSDRHNRKVLFIYNSKITASDHVLIQQSFNLKPCALIKKDSVWNIMIEEDKNDENICF